MVKASNSSQIFISGSLGFDRIMTLPGRINDFVLPECLDKFNVSFTVDSLRQEYGGTGGNCAYALGLLGTKPKLFSVLGCDGEEYRKRLEHCGVDTGFIGKSNSLSAVGHVMTDRNNQQIWMYYPGALRQAQHLRLESVITKDNLVLLMPSTPEIFKQHLREVIQVGCEFMFDPAFFIPNLTKEELDLGLNQAKIVIGNDYEIELLQDKSNSKINDWLKSGAVVIETLGEKGAVVYHQNEIIKVDIAKVKAVDPTGAGDAFRAGLVFGLLRGESWKCCLQMGMVTAAYCVETWGTQNYFYTPEDFWKRYKKNYN